MHKQNIAPGPWCIMLFLTRYVRWLFLAAMGVLPLWGCSTTDSEWVRQRAISLVSPLSVHVGRPFLIVKTDEHTKKGPDDYWGYVSHPFLMRFSSDRIALTYWLVGDGGSHGVAPAPWPFYSDDKGVTWLHGDPFNIPGIAADLLVHNKGDYVADFWHEGSYYFGSAILSNNVTVSYGYYAMVSEDGKVSAKGVWSGPDGQWSAPEPVTIRMPPHLTKSQLYFGRNGVVDESGSIWQVVFLKSPIDSKNISILLKSRDGGSHYDYVSTIADASHAPWSYSGVGEPAMTILPDGEFVCVIRTSAGKSETAPMLIARSADQGKNWIVKPMKQHGVMPILLQLDNGVLVLGYGRPGNKLMFSVDGGHKWLNYTNLPEGLWTTGYLDLVEVTPGRLLVVFDLLSTPDPTGGMFTAPRKVNGIYGIFIDVVNEKQ